MNDSRPCIWIDLDNAPHAHFFAPLVAGLEHQGFRALITARDFGQTEALARWHGMAPVMVGRHEAHRYCAGRVLETLHRAAQLVELGSAHRPIAAVSHGSRSLTLAAAILGIPCMALYDYEHVSAGIFHHLCQRVLMPQVVACDQPQRSRILGYPGFKEDVYVHAVRRDRQILTRLALDPARLVVTVRPPATWAHYHNDHSITLFRALLEHLRTMQDAQIVVLARTEAQERDLRREFRLDEAPFHLTSQAVDGLSLICVSDAVFSGGGTMVREAALLGAPAYSTFAGKPGAVDAELERIGKLTILRTTSEIGKVRLFKRVPTPPPAQNHTRNFILQQILDLATPGGFDVRNHRRSH